MRNLLILLFALYSIKTFGQEKKLSPQRPLSKFEKFSERAGRFIKREYIDVDNVDGLVFQVYKSTDMNTDSSFTAIKLTFGNTKALIDTNYLDSDELDGFLKAVNYMLEASANKQTDKRGFEYSYISRTDFSLTCFDDVKLFKVKRKWMVTFSMYPECPGMFNMDIEELARFKGAILHSMAAIKDL